MALIRFYHFLAHHYFNLASQRRPHDLTESALRKLNSTNDSSANDKEVCKFVIIAYQCFDVIVLLSLGLATSFNVHS